MVKFPAGTAAQGAAPADARHGRVRFVGEAVALVVAESPQAAQDAAELVEIEYRDLGAVIDAAAALRRRAAAARRRAGKSRFDFDYGDEKATEAALARAAHVTRVKLESTRVAANCMEPKACTAAWDAANGRFDIYFPPGHVDDAADLSPVFACRRINSGCTRATSAAASACARVLSRALGS